MLRKRAIKKIAFLICITIIKTTFGQTKFKKNMSEKEISLQTVLDKTMDGKKIFGTSFAIKKR
jgi:hypothetical protein